ncbi:MAG: hypothetical protein K6G47_01650 [Clostridia bacterium]|nr:hypothetical protein [Clostridiales bacterium]MCR5802943.1 hypothetical protein [Clostridia bacterium]
MKKTTKTALMAAAFAAAATGVAIAGAVGLKKYHDDAITAASKLQTHYGSPYYDKETDVVYENYF